MPRPSIILAFPGPLLFMARHVVTLHTGSSCAAADTTVRRVTRKRATPRGQHEAQRTYAARAEEHQAEGAEGRGEAGHARTTAARMRTTRRHASIAGAVMPQYPSAMPCTGARSCPWHHSFLRSSLPQNALQDEQDTGSRARPTERERARARERATASGRKREKERKTRERSEKSEREREGVSEGGRERGAGGERARIAARYAVVTALHMRAHRHTHTLLTSRYRCSLLRLVFPSPSPPPRTHLACTSRGLRVFFI